MNVKIVAISLVFVTVLLGTSLWLAGSRQVMPVVDQVPGLSKSPNSDTKGEFVSPETVSLFLRRSYDEKRDIILEVSTYAGGGCDQVSDLQATTQIEDQSLTSVVEGFTIEKYTGDDACPAVEHSASSKVIVTDFVTAGGGDVTIVLNGLPNTFTLRSDDSQITLNPINTSNVISHKSGINQPTQAQSVSVPVQ